MRDPFDELSGRSVRSRSPSPRSHHSCGRKHTAWETVAPSTFRCYDWIPRSTVTADPHKRNKQTQFMRPRKPVRLFDPAGPDKMRRKSWKKRTAQHSDLQQKPNRENSEKNRRFPGVWSVFPTREPEKSTSRPMSSPTRTLRQSTDPGGAGRGRPGGSPLDRRRHNARGFTDREWPRERREPRTRARSVPRVARASTPPGRWLAQ